MDIELYAHGIPNGKDYWNVPENDKKYIESFYSGKADVSVPVILEVNVRNSGERTYCYYTYIRTNILDNEGRTGSYFALTVRLDHYYRNIRFLYEFLDDAYNGLIIGEILTNKGGGVKYSIDEFSQKDDFLKKLVCRIQRNLIPWTRKSDFIPLEGFNTSSSSGLKMNLSDGGNERIEELVREKGSISVSPEFPSEKVLRLRGKIKIEDMEDEARRKESEIKNSYKEHLGNERKEYEQKISKLEQELREKQDEYQELKNKLSSIENARTEFNTQCNKILNIPTQHLDEGSFERGKGTPHGPQGRNGKTREPVEPGKTSNDSDEHAPHQKDTSWKKIIKGVIQKIKSWVNFILLTAILLVSVVAFQKINGFTGRQEYSPTTPYHEGETSELPKDHQEDVKESDPNEIMEEFFKENKLFFIDVKGISDVNPPTTKREYTLNIKTKDIGGEWTSKDSNLEISGNQIEAKQPGEYKIIYEVGGIPIASREIEFIERQTHESRTSDNNHGISPSDVMR